MAFPLTMPENRELTGGDLLAQSLKKLGTEVAFGLHGGHLDAFLLGCESIGIRLVDTRHETVAVQAAESYSKMTGKTGICFVTANSGFSNGLPGLATAFADRSPILCITSSVPLRDQENNSLQGQIDQVVVARTMTKFAHRVTSAEDLPRLVAHAVHISASGAPGPVLLDVPIDVLFTPITIPLISWGSISSPLPHLPGPHPAAIASAAAILRSAKRPALILGTGAFAAGPSSTASALSAFASAAPSTPILTTGKFAHLAPLHPLPTFAGPASALAALRHTGRPGPDCVVLAGARTGMYLGGRTGAIVPNDNCPLIHIDTDATELGRTAPVAVAIVSDAAAALSALAAALKSDSTTKDAPAPDPTWLPTLRSLHAAPSPFAAAPSTVPQTNALHPHHALSALFAALPAESRPVVVLDGGEAALWAGAIAEQCRPRALMSSTGYLGFLGNGFGYALGCGVAVGMEGEREKEEEAPLVVLVTGDGAAGFHFMELDSFARHGLRVLTVVVNNACWGMSRNGQDLVFGGKTAARPASGLSARLDFAVVARGLGCLGERAETLDEVRPKVERLLGGGKDGGRGRGLPGCLDLRVSAKPTHPGTEAMVSMTDDPNVIVVPYYDNVPRPHYKL
ncbi:benzaldehyde lyase [Diplodia corticola]|uniref:Benzaldehyde lyase n=1 Tax=Diplodia corticola TaxID=236234 RepID=A0A1J9QPK6_9PEZI|nr:benzaldehyde lyase [Diplodia corticola]OJD30393.1 benzaldehyde lyase [Diplodia corticola]